MAFKFLQNHPILALILALLFAHEILYTAFAASVGRMGGSIQLYSVHIGPIQSIPSTSVLFSLIWLYSVQLGLIRFI